MVRNLIFDFGRVLVNYDFDFLFSRLIPDRERLVTFSSFINDPSRVRVMDLGFKTFQEVVEDLKADLPGYDSEFDTFRDHKTEAIIEEVPGMRDLLSKLKAEGFRLYGLTNWDTEIYTTMAQFGIFKLLDGSIISSEEHVVKPGPEIYRRLFERFDLKPGECIFTDDKPENIEGGRRLGMDGIVFKDATQYETELRSLLK